MLRGVELLAFLAPLAAVVLWAMAVRRGLNGPPPQQLAWIAAVLVGLAAGLAVISFRDRLAPGHYVAPHTEDGVIVPGHVEPDYVEPGYVEHGRTNQGG